MPKLVTTGLAAAAAEPAEEAGAVATSAANTLAVAPRLSIFNRAFMWTFLVEVGGNMAISSSLSV